MTATTSGDYGGNPFSREAQMGADEKRKEPIGDDYDQGEGYKTGTSTPGYRHDDGTSPNTTTADKRCRCSSSREPSKERVRVIHL